MLVNEKLYRKQIDVLGINLTTNDCRTLHAHMPMLCKHQYVTHTCVFCMPCFEGVSEHLTTGALPESRTPYLFTYQWVTYPIITTTRAPSPALYHCGIQEGYARA